TACGETSQLKVADGMGPTPMLPEPNKTLIPTVNIAPAVGWAKGAKPVAAAGTQVSAFAEDLDHPRWLYVLPNGDVLVAETNSPAKP
ncbi:sorbosone dehydrogenase family protein, partial [Glaciimonas sp. Cout2]|nr:sorbosone dehydrogenase family protein [Glaciimonas sp. Cout2]